PTTPGGAPWAPEGSRWPMALATGPAETPRRTPDRPGRPQAPGRVAPDCQQAYGRVAPDRQQAYGRVAPDRQQAYDRPAPRRRIEAPTTSAVGRVGRDSRAGRRGLRAAVCGLRQRAAKEGRRPRGGLRSRRAGRDISPDRRAGPAPSDTGRRARRWSRDRR